jgi:hypothetical protein
MGGLRDGNQRAAFDPDAERVGAEGVEARRREDGGGEPVASRAATTSTGRGGASLRRRPLLRRGFARQRANDIDHWALSPRHGES